MAASGAERALTAIYRARLATGRAGTLALLAGLWARLYDPNDALASLRRIGTLAGVFTVRAQAAAVVQARAYLSSVTVAATGDAGDPYAIPDGVIGMTASGHAVATLTALAPAVYYKRTAAGQDETTAAQAAQSWLNRLAASEPFRSANTTVTHNATNDDRMTGLVIRITGPDACDFCSSIADDGYSPADAGFPAHSNCQCTASPEVAT